MHAPRWRWRNRLLDCWLRNWDAMHFGQRRKLRSSARWRNNIWCEGESPTEVNMATKCAHEKDHIKNVKPSSKGCEDCLKTGDTWVHLRMCLECGHVGCCDSSKNRHARAHFHTTQHPIIRSAERGEDWKWCYLDDTYL